ncbi:MAG: PKD domain-containing protein [Candidatus Thermoplasmatota archaeon]
MMGRVSSRSVRRCTVLLVVFFFGLVSNISLVQAADTPVRVAPSSLTVAAGSSFTVTIDCVPQQPVKAFELKLSFDPSLLRANTVTEGSIFEGYNTFFSAGEIDNTAGEIINVYNLIVGPGNVTDAGSLVSINFTAKTVSGTSPLRLYDVRLTNESDYLDISVASGSVTITGGTSPPPNPPPEPPENPPEENTPPDTPQTPGGPTLAQTGVLYSYTSTAIDPDGDSVRLRFDWGDGSLSEWSAFVASNTSVSQSHAWETVSNYSVRVIAQDSNGENSSWSEPLTVTISQITSEGFPPIVTFPMPLEPTTNRSVVFDASGCYDPDGTITSYLWDFGDGTTGTGAVLAHTYTAPGEYTVTLTVTDNAGLTQNYTQLVRIQDSAEASTDGVGVLFSNEIIIVLLALVATGIVLFLIYRYRTSETILLKQIESSKRRLAQMDQGTTDIHAIVDGLFSNFQHQKQTPRADLLLDAYNDLIVGRVEKHPAMKIPSTTIFDVERLVDDRLHKMIAEKLDKL